LLPRAWHPSQALASPELNVHHVEWMAAIKAVKCVRPIVLYASNK
jgi:hypothetical protein